MKRVFIIIFNVIIIAAIVGFVVFYAGFASRDSYRRQVEYFENSAMTIDEAASGYGSFSK